MHSKFAPKTHREAVAIFRAEIIGALVRSDLDHGELAEALRRLSKQRFRPPGSTRTRTYSVTTLERWYYAYRAGGLPALEPQRRSDAGRAHALTDAQRELLLDIRREHRSASVPVILRTLHLDGRLDKDTVSAQTLRRLYKDHGLDRIPLRDGSSPRTRLRWQAEHPGALWHADVMHGRSFEQDGKRKHVRVHALLDDASRYIVGLEALHTEREEDMLRIFVRALRTHGRPEALFLDNGSTYRGDILRIACVRLGITLVHARPYDPEARGKMERFWRTLREGCVDFIQAPESLHDINVRLWAFVGQHYHHAPHAGLLGKSPHSAEGVSSYYPSQACGHVNEPSVACDRFVKPGGESAAPLKPMEATLNQVAQRVELFIVPSLLLPVRGWWDNGLDAAFLQGVKNLVGIVGLVSNTIVAWHKVDELWDRG